MSKTFKSIAEGSNRTLTVLPALANDSRFRIEIEGDTSIRGILLTSGDAASIMLEVARAAGIVHHDPDDTPFNAAARTKNMGALNIAAFYLARHVNQAEKAAHIAAKEAADLEVLEGEALDLANTYRQAAGINARSTFAQFQNQSAWLALARKARELHGGTQ